MRELNFDGGDDGKTARKSLKLYECLQKKKNYRYIF